MMMRVPAADIDPEKRIDRDEIPGRRAAILRLLDTRFDNLPELKGSRSSHVSGFVHGKAHLSCPDCLGGLDGRKFGCETCGGAGYIVENRRDPYMTNDVVAYGLNGAERDREVALHEAVRVAGREAQRLGVGRPSNSADEVADANEHPYPWERARQLMFQRFDYAALERAVDVLAKSYPGMSPRSPQGLAFIDARMPDPIRAPKPTPKNDLRPALVVTPEEARQVELADRIRALAREGLRPDEIAASVSRSIRTVYRVLQEAA